MTSVPAAADAAPGVRVTLLAKWQCLSGAIRNARLSPLAKIVLAILLDCLNTRSRRCDPSHATIAARVGADERSVRRAIRELRDGGLIAVKRRRGTALYTINFDRPVLSAHDGAKTGQICPARPDKSVLSDRTKMSALYKKPGSEQGKRNREDIVRELKIALDDEHADAIVAHRKALKRPLTDRAAKLLAQQFLQTSDPNAAADLMIAKGWRGFQAEWLDKPTPRRNGSASASDFVQTLQQAKDRLE